jgi:thiol-disulfide isomerase/thioredoxin
MQPLGRRKLLHGAVGAAGISLLWPAGPARAVPVAKGPAPDFSLDDLDGRPHRLADYRGRVVLLNFWASWCPPCRVEMPSIERLYQSHSKRPFMVLGLNQRESAQDAFASLGLFSPMPTFPILLDSRGQVAKTYGVEGLPCSFVIGKDGTLQAKAEGARDFSSKAVLKYIDDLLA